MRWQSAAILVLGTIVDLAWLIAGWAVFVAWGYMALRLVLHVRSQHPLSALPDEPIPAGPLVCVIVPACNEAASIEACLRSLVAQDYPPLHVVAIDDRSSDDTGAIMDWLAGLSSRLSVIHVTDLPPGWLGKNHANHLGVQHPQAGQADWLLFTDGDIHFDPDTVRRAVAWAERAGVDHLCMIPHMLAGSVAERAMCVFFGMCYLFKCRPWDLNNKRRPGAFTGVGAFNLVRCPAYRAAGGHEALRLEVADDYKLGKLLKQSGARSMLLDSGQKIRVRWHVGLGGIVRGLEKNAFAGFDYALAAFAVGLAGLLAGFCLPVAAAVATPGAARWGWLAAALGPMSLMGWLARRTGMSPLIGLASPGCALILGWACVRSAVLTLGRSGIRWRGTFYPLSELRAGKV